MIGQGLQSRQSRFMKTHFPDREMAIVLYCAKTMLGNFHAEELKRYITDQLDWQLVINIALKHGLINFLYVYFKSNCRELIPEEILNQLKTYYFQNSSRNILLGSSLIKILNLLKLNKISAIPFKGPVQSELIYHDIGIRIFADLDILVKKQDVLQAMDILMEQGFITSINIPESQIDTYLEKENFFQIQNKSGSINIDLHWEISGRYSLKPIYYPTSEDVLHPTMLLSNEINTLNHEDTLIYLCVHGTSHCWEKLEMICSVATIVKSGKIDKWESIIQKAKIFRCKRMVLLGLLLARYFFCIDLPMIITTAVADDNGLEKLLNYIIKKIENRNMAFTESLSWRFSPIHFQARDSLLDSIKYFFYLFFQPTIREWDKYHLPDSLLFLYHVLRPYRLIREGLSKKDA